MLGANKKGPKKTALLILDGFGVPQVSDSPFSQAKLSTFNFLEKFFPITCLQASGLAVGLPWGEEGNSEVGHLTIGSGREIWHHLPRISISIQNGSFFKNEALLKAADHVRKNNSKLHLIGLFSSGSVHSYADHLYALLEFSKRQNLGQVFLHLFTDGRDSQDMEAEIFFGELTLRISSLYPFAKIASVIGRNYAMDRDANWNKIEASYDLFVDGKGAFYEDPAEYIKNQYAKGITDEFIEPASLKDDSGGAVGRISVGDACVFFNFREDSARELTRAFTDEGFDNFFRKKLENFIFVTMTQYEKGEKVLVAFPPIDVGWPLSRVISQAGLKQLHIAETEKYAHVTYFFNGGTEEAFPGEERILIPSVPGVNFDERPEMSAEKITETVLEKMADYDFVLINFANGDMVGHTGNFEATVKALETLDLCAGKIVKKSLELGRTLIVTGDHGNAEEKRYRVTGEKRTKHSLNPVPFYLVADEFKLKKPRKEEESYEKLHKVGGVLTDVAPTILKLMDLPVPVEMTGISLLERILEKN